MERTRKVGIKFNRVKSKVLLNEIKFIGHVFDKDGVRPDGQKINAILEMPIPNNVSELQRFLGMTNYLGMLY